MDKRNKRRNPYHQTFTWSDWAQVVMGVFFALCLGALLSVPIIIKMEFFQAATQYLLTH